MSNSDFMESFEVDPMDDGPKLEWNNMAAENHMNVKEFNVLLAPSETSRLVEGLRGDEMSGRIVAAQRLDAIASALGAQRTREELLPFLLDVIMDDEDEVLLAIASSLGRLVDHIGGPSHATSLLPPLEQLLTVEETSVRDQALESAKKIGQCLPIPSFQNDYAEMVLRLAREEWFTARISGAFLLPFVYQKLATEQQEQCMEEFVRLCKDDTAVVRKSAAQHLGSMLQQSVKVLGRSCLEPNAFVAEQLIPLYEYLAFHEQPDAVRLQTSQNCISFGQVMSEFSGPLSWTEKLLIQRILPLVTETVEDRSMRVRWTSATKFADVVAAFSLDDMAITDSLMTAFEKLLKDQEEDVRTAATFHLAHVAKVVDESVAERLVTSITPLTEDDSEHVRAALAMVATELAPILGRNGTITHLVPPVLLLLRDASPQVRINLISSLAALNEVIGVDLLSQSILPAILDLAQDGKWRIRLAIIQHIPLLAKQLGKDFFTEKLTALSIGWLEDATASIRKAAASNLKELALLFGTEWAIEFLIPSLVEMCQHKSYLRRLTAVQACSLMCPAFEPEAVQTTLLPLVLEMATDAVPNIRFNVAKELGNMALVCGGTICESQINPILNLLRKDTDRDVRFYACKSTNAILAQ